MQIHTDQGYKMALTAVGRRASHNRFRAGKLDFPPNADIGCRSEVKTVLDFGKIEAAATVGLMKMLSQQHGQERGESRTRSRFLETTQNH